MKYMRNGLYGWMLAVAFLLGLSACANDSLEELSTDGAKVADGTMSFQLTQEGNVLPGHSKMRAYIAERSLDQQSAADGALYCAKENRLFLNGSEFQAKNLKMQWYKFTFLRVPDGISVLVGQERFQVKGDELFSDLRSSATDEEKNTSNFSRLLIDYTDLLLLQEKDHASSLNYDLHIYRGGVERWMKRPGKEGEAIPEEKVTLRRITGELSLNMGILPNQFEHRVSEILITAKVPIRVFVSDNQMDDEESQVLLDDVTTEERTYVYKVPEKYSDPKATEPCRMKMVLLPCTLEGKITVKFTDSSTPEVYTIKADADIPTVQIKPNVRTSLLFNGMFKGEFEVRYAGFDGSVVDVAPDQWNGGWPVEKMVVR